MAKQTFLFNLLISCPSDVSRELYVINEAVSDWNKENGDLRNARIEPLYWKTHSFPSIGGRPQEIINKQIVEKCDIIIGVFWTKFGSPTGKSDSGTEEEIKLGISLGKEVMVYFCERPISPSLLDGNQYKKILDFKKEFSKSGLYWTYKSLREFKKYLKLHLSKTIDNLINIKSIKTMKSILSNDQKVYAEPNHILMLIDDNFDKYFNMILKIQEESEIKKGNAIFKKDKKIEKEKVKNIANNISSNIVDYSKKFNKHFNLNILEKYKVDYTFFKRDVFGKEPWTVTAALLTPDQELIRYRAAFSNVTGREVYNVVKRIIEKADAYCKASIKKQKDIKSIEDLQYDFLNAEDMLLPGVIGLGIRSEILHRLYPDYFSIMTRKSIWGMYYLTNNAADFIRKEKNRDNSFRISHEWEYEYARFTFYCNYVTIKMQMKFEEYGIKIDDKLWFGYSAQFLNAISELFFDEIKNYLEWKGIK